MEQKTKILIVDDEQTNIKILLEILDFEDAYITKTVTSGEECLAVLPEFGPDIILLDIMMSGMDGYDVCRHIRKDPVHCDVKILILSGRAMPDEIHKGIDAGADNYISKPFGMNDLLDALKKLLQNHEGSE
ncbi:MAG TPA: response regulator [Desulfocapsa sulfexigens]|nr:response regulator [Desulfocapsa sulfexigens]